MGFFKKLFTYNDLKPQTGTEYILPQVIVNCTSPNPFTNKYKDNSLDNRVYLLYCDYYSFERWINDTNKPESYFINFIKAIQILSELTNIKFYRFNSPKPDEQLHNLKSNYINLTNAFIHRYWKTTIESANKLKTEKGKQNKLQRFFDTLLINYKDYLLDDNITFIEQLRQADNIVKYQPNKVNVICKNYDVSTIQGIQAIPYNDYEAMRLLQKAATNHKRNGDLILAVECLKKSNAISDTLPFGSKVPKLLEKEYLRIISYTKKAYGEEKSIETEKEIRKKHPEFWDKRITNRLLINECVKHCNQHNIDLVEVFSRPSCSVCGIYDKMIFSLSGKNKIYPKLPNEILKQTIKCKGCYINISAYYSL